MRGPARSGAGPSAAALAAHGTRYGGEKEKPLADGWTLRETASGRFSGGR
jgi:hypothetical protein